MFNTKRLCFLHIPKTAGTSISSILTGWYPDQQIFQGLTTLDYDQLNDEEITEYRLYKGHMPFIYASARLPADTLYVTLLREPIERVISLYYFWRGYSDDYLNDESMSKLDKLGPTAAKSMDIIEFFSRDDVHLLILRATRNGQLSYLSTLKNKNSFMQKETKAILMQNVNENLKYVSVLGVQTQLPFFVYELRKLLGISQPQVVPHINASQRNKHFANLTDQDREKLVEVISEHNQAELVIYKEIEQNVQSRIREFFKTMSA